jgi:cytidine deaminase
MNNKILIQKAREVMANAYAPYSKFKVGAALLTQSGKIYTGCNIENISYGATVCAERVALFKAVSEGEKKFSAIAIVNSSPDIVFPCGICRQCLAEFGLDLTVIVANNTKTESYILKDLIPHAFDSFTPTL